jgi:hypothetical protein
MQIAQLSPVVARSSEGMGGVSSSSSTSAERVLLRCLEEEAVGDSRVSLRESGGFVSSSVSSWEVWIWTCFSDGSSDAISVSAGRSGVGSGTVSGTEDSGGRETAAAS